MLFDPNVIIASTTQAASGLTSYTLSPIITIGFIMAVIIAVIAVAYTWIIKKGIRGAGRAIGVK